MHLKQDCVCVVCVCGVYVCVCGVCVVCVWCVWCVCVGCVCVHVWCVCVCVCVWCTLFNKAPECSMVSPSNATKLGPFIQIHELLRDISHSRHCSVPIGNQMRRQWKEKEIV